MTSKNIQQLICLNKPSHHHHATRVDTSFRHYISDHNEQNIPLIGEENIFVSELSVLPLADQLQLNFSFANCKSANWTDKY